MVGAAVNVARANWLFKFEAAGFNGMEFDAAPADEQARIDALLVIEYAGLTDMTISLEAASRHMIDYDERLGRGPGRISENEFQWALRITRDFMHERLSTTLLVNIFDAKGEDGAFERLELSDELNDHWELTTGAVLYQGGDNHAFERIKKNDRLFTRLEYAF